MSKIRFDAEYDVVVLGAGSAGCVLAARLTENPNVSLCVIEAGGRDRNPWIHIPMGFGKLVPDPKMNWGFETEEEPGLEGRKIVWPRGKVLGGSGSINGMVFLRGAPTDYDSWEALGAKGWSYKDVLPYFKRMEHCVDGANEWRSTGGPMTISNIKRPSTAAKAFVEACERLQHPRNPDFNGERIDGVGSCAAERAQRLAPLDRGRLSQAEPQPSQPRIDDEHACAEDPARRPPCGRRRGRARRTDPAHRRAARADRVERRDQFAGAAAGLGHRPCGGTEGAGHRGAARSAGRRQEPAGPLPLELRLQDHRDRHAERGGAEQGEVGEACAGMVVPATRASLRSAPPRRRCSASRRRRSRWRICSTSA